MRKHFRLLALTVALIMIVGMVVGCSQENADISDDNPKPTDSVSKIPEGDLIGTGAVKFDPNKEISGKLTVWFYEGSERIIGELFEDYQKYRPNVELKVTYMPWGDYWTKLPVSLASGVGPDLYYFHNMHHTTVVDEGLQDSYPADLIEGIKQDFDNIDQFILDDNLYYAPVGGGHGMIYYNKTLWAEAGLTEADIPETWEEMHDIALKLTKHEGDNVSVAGFNLTPWGGFSGDWVYLSGYFQYSEDGNEIVLDRPEIRETYEYFLSWYDDGITEPTFPEPIQSFRDGTSAMIWQHPWLAGSLKVDNPDLDFGVFALPRFEAMKRNWHFNNPDVSMGINAAASDEGKALAADMLRLFFAEDKYLKNWALQQGLAPTKKTLYGDAELEEHPIISVQMADYENTIYLGGSVAGVTSSLEQDLIQPLILGGMTWDEVIDTVIENCNKALQESDWMPVERLSALADELK